MLCLWKGLEETRESSEKETKEISRGGDDAGSRTISNEAAARYGRCPIIRDVRGESQLVREEEAKKSKTTRKTCGEELGS